MLAGELGCFNLSNRRGSIKFLFYGLTLYAQFFPLEMMYYMSNLRKKGLEVVRHGHPCLMALAWMVYFREHAGVCGKIPLDVSASVVAGSFPLVSSCSLSRLV